MPKQKKLKRQSDPAASMVIFIRIDPTVGSQLQTLADDDKRKLASYCRLILEDHVEKARKTA